MYWKLIRLSIEEIVPSYLTHASDIKHSKEGKIGLKFKHYALE